MNEYLYRAANDCDAGEKDFPNYLKDIKNEIGCPVSE
jgi:hypothetical protein